MAAIQQTIDFLKIMLINGITQFEVAAKNYVTDEIKPSRGPLDLSDEEAIAKRLRWLMRTNSNGQQIWGRPVHDYAWPVVFLDDVAKPKALQIATKYKSVVVETSLNNTQVWIFTTSSLTLEERTAVQSSLVTLLGEGGADLASKDGMHFGRLPGFQNRKPGASNWTNMISRPRSALPKLDPAPHLISSPSGGRRVMAKPQASTNLKSIGALSGEVGGSQSEEDIRMALRRLRKGASPEHMVESLAEQALARGKRKTRPAAESYARLTVEKALLYLSKGR